MSMTIDKSRGNYPAVEYMLLCMGKRRAVGITAKPDNFSLRHCQCAVFYHVVTAILHGDQRGAAPDTVTVRRGRDSKAKGRG